MTGWNIEFRKFVHLNRLEGEYSFAIFDYGKRPFIMKTRIEPITKGVKMAGYAQQYVAQYKKYLIVDLWICVLRFRWLTKEITK